MPLPAGQRDQRITFQAQAEGVDASGQPNGAWVDLPDRARDWARVRPRRGAEFVAGEQLQARADVVFNVRYRADVTERLRIIWNGAAYEIVAPPILFEGAKFDMEIECVAGIRNG